MTESNTAMLVFVKTMIGKTISVQIFEDSTVIVVLQIKMMIHQEIGMFPDQQVLMYQNEELDDDDTHDKYNIEDGATINLIPKVASGFVFQ